MSTRHINPNKLLLSKWTVMRPSNREKHFLVTELVRDELDNVLFVEIEAVLTKRVQRLDWHDLSDAERWQPGWR